MMIPEFTTTRNMPDIAPLIERAVREGAYFPHDPSGNGDVQIRVNRDATPEGHRLAAALRERRDEVNAHFKVLRPAWPIKDDGWAPRLDPAEPDATIFLIQLEAHIAEAEVLNTIEEAGRKLLASRAGFAERVDLIVARAVAARRSAAPVKGTARPHADQPRAVEFRGGKVVQR